MPFKSGNSQKTGVESPFLGGFVLGLRRRSEEAELHESWLKLVKANKSLIMVKLI